MRYLVLLILAVAAAWVVLLLFAAFSKRGRQAQLARAVVYVKLGLAERLAIKYRLTYGEAKAKWIAAAIVNHIFGGKGTNPEGASFATENREIIESELSRLQLDDDSQRLITQLAQLTGNAAWISHLEGLGVLRRDTPGAPLSQVLVQAGDYCEAVTPIPRTIAGNPP